MGAFLKLAKEVGKAVIPSNTVVGKAIGSTYTGKGLDLQSLLPEGSKSQKIVQSINKTGNAIGQYVNPNATVSSLQSAQGGSSALINSTSSMSKLESAYTNDMIAKTSLGAGNGYTMTGTVPVGSLNGQLQEVSDPSGVSGSIHINPFVIVGVVVAFLILK